MLKIQTLILGTYQTNCYVLSNDERCVLIDPGYEPEGILSFLKSGGLKLEAILLTHGHFDHVGGVETLVQETHCDLWMHKNDWAMPLDLVHLHYFPLADCDFTDVKFCKEGDMISAADLAFTVLETPGHTPGSLCYQCENALFTGDTLFAGSCGRTDLPEGNWSQIKASLCRLKDIRKNLRVYPGHGTSSTLIAERHNNPYLR